MTLPAATNSGPRSIWSVFTDKYVEIGLNAHKRAENYSSRQYSIYRVVAVARSFMHLCTPIMSCRIPIPEYFVVWLCFFFCYFFRDVVGNVGFGLWDVHSEFVSANFAQHTNAATFAQFVFKCISAIVFALGF